MYRTPQNRKNAPVHRRSPQGRSPLQGPYTPEPLADDQVSVASSRSAASSYGTHGSSDVGVPPPSSVAAAVHEVPSLLSQLVSGNPDEQVLAARKLFKYCRSGEEVQRAVVAEGGVHMLLIMLDSLDNVVRDLCTRTLTDLAAEDSVRLDIVSAPGGVSKVVQIMYKGVLEGQTSAGKFLEMLATSEQEAVQAACCHAKVVRMLTKTLGSLQNPRATAGALGALRAFCRDPSNISKMVWAGGVTAMLNVLDKGDVDQCVPALQLLAMAARQSPDSMQGACEPYAVVLLSQYIGSSEFDLQAQSLAAEVLAAVTALPKKKEAALASLVDHTLPRACEVVRSLQAEHDAARAAAAGQLPLHSPGQSPTEQLDREQQEQLLLKSCSAIVAHLAQCSPPCLRVIVYHTASLKVTVGALVATRQCGLAHQLLQASMALAGRAPSSGASGSRVSTAAAAAAEL